jgi:hypothetical protein
MFDWHIRTDEIGEEISTFRRLFEVECITLNNGWSIIRCKTPDQRRALQDAHHQRSYPPIGKPGTAGG